MPYRTVNLKPATYRRLASYKVAGISFDDVVGLLMEEVGPRAVKDLVLARLAAQEAAPVDEADGDGEDGDTVEFRESRNGRGVLGRFKGNNTE